ncbi:MAG: hypothetical protein V4735_05305 [Pseudomonadota bacterium]
MTADAQGFTTAAAFFAQQAGGFLNDQRITEDSDVGALGQDQLYLLPHECRKISAMFHEVVASGQPRHIYCDTVALKELEILISYKEYENLV